MPIRQRRTQAERRAATRASLLDGTIATLSELGYARTTVKEICARAGVSAGALFGHYPTLTDLILAAAAEVSRRQVESFESYVAELPDAGDTRAVLARVRTGARDPINSAWIELLIAARTDATLRERIRPVGEAYAHAIMKASLRVPMLAALPHEIRRMVVTHVVHYFDGEALSAVLYPDAELDDRRLDMLTTLIESYVERKISHTGTNER